MSGCLPSNRLCGRWCVEPFVQEINRRHGVHFEYQECLDAVYRNSPQPEARYRDAQSGRDLVVEHKRLIWPANHAERHARDHRVAAFIVSTVGVFLTDAPYALHLPFRVGGTDQEVDSFAREVADSVVRHLELIRTGTAVGHMKGPRPWKIRREWLDERNDDDPAVGLVVRWDDFTDELDPALRRRRVADCSRTIEGFCLSSGRKFRSYAASTRILLVELVDDLWLMNDELRRMFPKPLLSRHGISEVWIREDEWVSNTEKDATFRQMLPTFEGLEPSPVEGLVHD